MNLNQTAAEKTRQNQLVGARGSLAADSHAGCTWKSDPSRVTTCGRPIKRAMWGLAVASELLHISGLHLSSSGVRSQFCKLIAEAFRSHSLKQELNFYSKSNWVWGACLFLNTFQLLSYFLTEFSSEAHAVSFSATQPHFKEYASHEYLTLNAELKPKLLGNVH